MTRAPRLAAAAVALALLLGACTTAVPPAPVTVQGRVVDALATPVGGATVQLTGSVTAVSATDGGFTLELPPGTTGYDATVVVPGQQAGFVFDGLTRTDPTLQLDGLFLAHAYSTDVSGTLSGIAFPITSNERYDVFFGSADLGGGGLRATGGAGAVFNAFTMQWTNASTTHGTLYALAYQVDGGGLPTHYLGFGSRSVDLSDGVTIAGQDIALSPAAVSDATLSGTVDLPAGYGYGNPFNGTLALVSPDPVTSDLLVGSTTLPAFSFVMPDLAGASYAVGTIASDASGNGLYAWRTGLAADASGVVVQGVAAPTLGSPADGATQVTTATPFTFTAFPGGVHEVTFEAAGGLRLVVVTAGTTVTLPDLSALGLAVPAGTAFTWRVASYAPYADLDAAAGPRGFGTDATALVGTIFEGTAGPGADGSAGFAASRTFTTAP